MSREILENKSVVLWERCVATIAVVLAAVVAVLTASWF
jgi:hypothetical protein